MSWVLLVSVLGVLMWDHVVIKFVVKFVVKFVDVDIKQLEIPASATRTEDFKTAYKYANKPQHISGCAAPLGSSEESMQIW